MFNEAELIVLRRAYARQIAFLGDANNAALERAYAEVPREAYLGPGPWPIFRWTGYTQTPDADPAWLYSDILVGLVPERGLNNGQPSAHAGWIAAAAPLPGEHVVHIGAGAGYYSAIMAHMVGSAGTLTAIEYDPALAACAAANLAHLPNVLTLHGDGSVVPIAPADVIYVNAGASRPADTWLDGLKQGGRLILPLTTKFNFGEGAPDFSRPSGAVFRITRRGSNFDADFIGDVAVFPCEGARDEASEQALAAAFGKGGYRDVKRLLRTDDVPEEECWVRAPGWSLTYR
ncbi:MAG TPA: methyltransferase [Hypericibacter adhaerens]|uniref:Protein-L-isoaspartate O-methyltransferase n=1 Tax=Hypericibacter adhaerens TaxID=2602016 RepID=A0A5J6MV80_9PROT|nr:protein-L-isoaspartate O-methyltransferase [Hypericibacter adhaerens]QEX21578.1 SAM-dependent methyltransferase [Hypericibacter adhaerens]HWA46519.1 methyltransferase [Hypericibacter adhaerens]